MLDVVSQFQPFENILRAIDGMEVVKMNVLHLRLSDDQAFRLESKTFPLLQKKSSYGEYYNETQMSFIVKYANQRGIRVIPEFGMPGHSSSILYAYPSLSSKLAPTHLPQKFGIFNNALNPTSNATYEWLEKFVSEYSKIFKDNYFHMGGEKIGQNSWNVPDIEVWSQKISKGGEFEEELEKYFNSKVIEILKNNGKIAVGWDEVMDKEIPKNVIIESKKDIDTIKNSRKNRTKFLECTRY